MDSGNNRIDRDLIHNRLIAMMDTIETTIRELLRIIESRDQHSEPWIVVENRVRSSLGQVNELFEYINNIDFRDAEEMSTDTESEYTDDSEESDYPGDDANTRRKAIVQNTRNVEQIQQVPLAQPETITYQQVPQEAFNAQPAQFYQQNTYPTYEQVSAHQFVTPEYMDYYRERNFLEGYHMGYFESQREREQEYQNAWAREHSLQEYAYNSARAAWNNHVQEQQAQCYQNPMAGDLFNGESDLHLGNALELQCNEEMLQDINLDEMPSSEEIETLLNSVEQAEADSTVPEIIQIDDDSEDDDCVIIENP